MPQYRLRERRVSRFPVFPYVTETDTEYEVTLAVVIGFVSPESAFPTFSFEDVEAQLFDSNKRIIKILQRPEGPLPIGGGLSLTANARFRFDRTEGVPRTLVVRVGETNPVEFSWDERSALAPTAGRPKTAKVMKKDRAGTCIKYFEVPIQHGGCVKYPDLASQCFFMKAVFGSKGDCRCEHFEYRQLVSGALLIDGVALIHQLPGGMTLDLKEYREDGIVDGGQEWFYGHRDVSGLGDRYYDPPDRKIGCKYEGFDCPRAGRRPEVSCCEVKLDFKGQVLDMNSPGGAVVMEKKWKIRCKNY